MTRGRIAARTFLVVSVLMLVVAVVGFVVTLVLNAFVLDKYNAYGELPVPGSGSVHLPAGQVTVSFHTVVIGSTSGTGLPVPPLSMTIHPPAGVSEPAVTESIGSTTTVNNDAHVRVWLVQVPAEGTYQITTDGQVNGFISPRLAFGHKSSYGFLVWVFVGLFVVGLLDLVVSVMWLARIRRSVPPAVMTAPYAPTVSPVVTAAPVGAQVPTDQAVKLEQLKTLAALRDSGALTDKEFETEKRRILDGR